MITPLIRVLIASPLEQEHVATIQGVLPSHVELLYDPSLLPSPRYVGDHQNQSGSQRTPEQDARWREMIASADIAFDFPYLNEHPHLYAPKLKWVQTTSAGVGQLVTRLGIAPGELIVTTASGVHARPLTEFVFMVLLMAMKDFARIASGQLNHHWERFCADELSGKTIAVIGPGRIGQDIAHISRSFGMHPIALARDSRPERAAELGFDQLFTRHEMPVMLQLADALVVCAPHTLETENIMDEEAFNLLKPGVVFVNIGRGELIDENALIGKLQDGTIRFAGLDVFRTEPLPSESPFWDLPNVIVSPHSASTSTRENARIVDIFVHNLTCFLEGRRDNMQNVLNIKRMY